MTPATKTPKTFRRMRTKVAIRTDRVNTANRLFARVHLLKTKIAADLTRLAALEMRTQHIMDEVVRFDRKQHATTTVEDTVGRPLLSITLAPTAGDTDLCIRGPVQERSTGTPLVGGRSVP